MYKNIKDKINALLDNYDAKLAEKGIACKISKKYFEEAVHDRSPARPSNPLNIIDHFIDRRNEKKYGGVRNRYHIIVLQFVPLKRSVLKGSDCKEYAFYIKKTERAHTGLAPEKKIYSEDEILKKIEKRILKIIAKVDKSSPEKSCRNSFFDGVRYFFSVKYNYKDTILGINRDTYDILAIVFMLTLAALVFFVSWLIVY